MLRPLRHGLMLYAFRFAVWFCPKLTHRGALRLGRFLGRGVCFFSRKERQKALKNLHTAYGSEMDEGQRHALTKKVFESLGMTLLESFHSRPWTADYFVKVVGIEGEQHWRAALGGGKGVIFVSGHCGNWELMPRAFHAHFGIAASFIMRDMKNEKLSRAIEDLRGEGVGNIYSTERSVLGFVRELKRGGIVAMMIDQDTKRLRGIFLDFFGRPALTPVGPAYIARRTGSPLVLVTIVRRDDDPSRHEIKFGAPIYSDPSLGEDEDIERMLQAATSMLEEQIRIRPEQWAWIHERWKRSPDDGDSIPDPKSKDTGDDGRKTARSAQLGR